MVHVDRCALVVEVDARERVVYYVVLPGNHDNERDASPETERCRGVAEEAAAASGRPRGGNGHPGETTGA